MWVCVYVWQQRIGKGGAFPLSRRSGKKGKPHSRHWKMCRRRKDLHLLILSFITKHVFGPEWIHESTVTSSAVYHVHTRLILCISRPMYPFIHVRRLECPAKTHLHTMRIWTLPQLRLQPEYSCCVCTNATSVLRHRGRFCSLGNLHAASALWMRS